MYLNNTEQLQIMSGKCKLRLEIYSALDDAYDFTACNGKEVIAYPVIDICE